MVRLIKDTQIKYRNPHEKGILKLEDLEIYYNKKGLFNIAFFEKDPTRMYIGRKRIEKLCIVDKTKLVIMNQQLEVQDTLSNILNSILEFKERFRIDLFGDISIEDPKNCIDGLTISVVYLNGESHPYYYNFKDFYKIVLGLYHPLLEDTNIKNVLYLGNDIFIFRVDTLNYTERGLERHVVGIFYGYAEFDENTQIAKIIEVAAADKIFKSQKGEGKIGINAVAKLLDSDNKLLLILHTYYPPQYFGINANTYIPVHYAIVLNIKGKTPYVQEYCPKPLIDVTELLKNNILIHYVCGIRIENGKMQFSGGINDNYPFVSKKIELDRILQEMRTYKG